MSCGVWCVCCFQAWRWDLTHAECVQTQCVCICSFSHFSVFGFFFLDFFYKKMVLF